VEVGTTEARECVVEQQQLLAQSQQQSQRAPQVEFKCGKMNKAEGATTVTPDLRKGKLTVKADQDQLMHVIWTNREQGEQCCGGPGKCQHNCLCCGDTAPRSGRSDARARLSTRVTACRVCAPAQASKRTT